MRNLSLASRNRSLFNKLLNLRYVASRLASYNCSRRAKYNFGCSFIALLLAGSFIAGNLTISPRKKRNGLVCRDCSLEFSYPTGAIISSWIGELQGAVPTNQPVSLFSWACRLPAIKLPASSRAMKEQPKLYLALREQL